MIYHLKNFFIFIPTYFYSRLLQFFIFCIVFLELFQDVLASIKFFTVSRLFWGRSNLYRNFLHIFMLFVTSIVLITSIFNRLNIKAHESTFTESYSNSDILTPSGTVTTAEVIDPNFQFYTLRDYIVKDGDTLQSISEKFLIAKDTIRWANLKIMGPFSDRVEPGWQLKIPSMDGVLYKIRPEDTIWSIADNLQSNIFYIAEINNLKEPDYALTVGETILVPDGKLSMVATDTPVTEDQLIGAFEDPLTHEACTGYRFYGGLNSYPGHDGVDLGISGGCPVRSIAAGTVFYAGWEERSGYTVKIDHGGGVKSYYYHGNGEIWVKKGDYIGQGHDIMYMGNTGNSYGTHLHLTIKLNGKIIDPVRYVPMKKF